VDPCVVVPFVRLFHPVVATSHGQAYRRDKWGVVFRSLSRLAERIFITAPRKCTAVSRTLSDYYGRRYGRTAEYVPNGVTIEKPAGPEHLRPFGLEKDGYILFVGRLLATKGPQLLIDAYKKAKPGVKLVIAGGSSHTDEYERSLQNEASDDIRFIGYQYGETLRSLYSNCRLFVFPSFIEGLPLVLLEALSFLRPVVFSDIPENMEIARDLGIPFRSGSVEDLAAKLDYALAHAGEMESLQRATMNRLVQEYDWDRVTDRYLQIYRDATTA
jgi:glycosyltransferase involved in cell wall biosynthesis